MDYVKLAKMVREWVEEAGDILRDSLADTSIKIEEKTAPSDLVTEMDRYIEAFFVKKIQAHFPNHRIYGEEGTYDVIEDLNGFIWIIDPIDGTLNYVKQKSNFCTMITLFKDGEGVMAFINDVIHEKLYHGVVGHGVYCNDERLEPIPHHHLNEGLVALNTKMVMLHPEISTRIVREALGVRLIGSAGLEMVQVLTNRVSAYVTTPLSSWDIAPGFMLGKELGLTFTRTDGLPINLVEKNPIIIANAIAYEDIINKFIN